MAMNTIPSVELEEVPSKPTYGLLIDLLDLAEKACNSNPALCLRHVLAAWFCELYPETRKITRPSRFEATVRRVAAPVKSSLRGDTTLTGSNLLDYRKEEWILRFRDNPVAATGEL